MPLALSLSMTSEYLKVGSGAAETALKPSMGAVSTAPSAIVFENEPVTSEPGVLDLLLLQGHRSECSTRKSQGHSSA